MAKAQELIEKIEKLQEESAKTMRQLKRSLAIRELWPEVVFPCTSNIEGSPSKGFFYLITSKTGETKQFDLNEIPEPIAEQEHIQKQLRHCKRWRMKGARNG